MPSREVLEGTLQLLSYMRNICAHHARLWNRHTVKRLPYSKRFKLDLDIKFNDLQHQPSNQVYNALVVLIHLIRHQSVETTFPTRLKDLVETRPGAQLRSMGFPEDRTVRPCWAG